MRMTMKQYLALPHSEKPGRNKYHNRRTVYGGREYDSAKEALFAKTLDTLKKAKKKEKRVTQWIPQVRFKVVVNRYEICTYVCDFQVYYADGHIEYFDVKGYKKGGTYRMFRIKKDLVLATRGIEIQEI